MINILFENLKEIGIGTVVFLYFIIFIIYYFNSKKELPFNDKDIIYIDRKDGEHYHVYGCPVLSGLLKSGYAPIHFEQLKILRTYKGHKFQYCPYCIPKHIENLDKRTGGNLF